MANERHHRTRLPPSPAHSVNEALPLDSPDHPRRRQPRQRHEIRPRRPPRRPPVGRLRLTHQPRRLVGPRQNRHHPRENAPRLEERQPPQPRRRHAGRWPREILPPKGRGNGRRSHEGRRQARRPRHRRRELLRRRRLPPPHGGSRLPAPRQHGRPRGEVVQGLGAGNRCGARYGGARDGVRHGPPGVADTAPGRSHCGIREVRPRVHHQLWRGGRPRAFDVCCVQDD
mmetsp:Transcript_5349/g.13947  ORF Transcript_5349/g.13947 Transcript_5349/m.13947 type:complete len:228 (-) Transcript_5349:1545-2228(-)